MLEKIGLPPKPSQRGSNWVVDASHCQGCSSQFTFINRKHHCRRCGGLFCNGCTQQRMALRGQGDSPVRICEPCKKLEEASRFEMRYGHKNRAGKGSSRLTAKSEDEVLNQILGDDGIGSSHMVSSIESARCTASSSTAQLEASLDEAAIHRSSSLGEAFHVNSELESSSPEKLRQKALDEKKRYRILKGEGKSDEALKAFKRGKELEREADALELSIRKNRKKSLPSGNRVEPQSKDGPKESGRKGKLLDQVGKEKVDLTAELRELGWSDMDVQGGGKGSANMSLEGELYSLLGDVSQRANKDKETGGVDKTQVTAHKRKALTLKREGKLAEAKEELKKAKLLERQLEEQELLGGAEDSDDEISALIRSMGDGKQDELLVGADAKQEHGLDFNHLINTPDDLDAVAEFDVTDEDMMDPEMADALKSLGWVDGSDSHENVVTESVSVRREALLSEILALKKEALNQKRAGNVAEAMAQLKKAKLLERDLESLGGEEGNVAAVTKQKGSTPQRINAKKEVDAIVAPKSKMMIQKELLALKKKALALRREGKLDEADEELKRGKVLEEQLEEMNNVSKGETTRVNVGGANPDLEHEYFGSTAVGEDGEEQVTDTDMYDPTYLSILRNLGWKDDNELANSTAKPSKGNNHDSLSVGQSSVTQASSNISTLSSRSSKADIQRELLSLKRKDFTLRREGKVSEAEEVLRTAKTLEARLVDIETPQKDAPPVESGWHKHETVGPLAAESGEGDEDGDDVTDNDMRDPSLLSVLTDLGWKDEELEPGIAQVPPSNTAAASLVLSTDQYPNPHPPIISAVRPKSKFKVQQELLGLKRKAFAFRRKGETEEAEELLKMAKVLEAQLEEMEVSESALLPDTCKDSASLNPVLKHVNGSVKNVEEKGEEVAKVAVLPDEKCVDSFIGFGSNTGAPPSTSSNNVIPVEPQLIEDNHPLVRESHTLGEMGALNTATTISGTGFVPPANQTVNMMDLLTGDDWRATQMPAEKPADKVNSDSSSQLGSINKAPGHLGSKKHEVSSVTDISSGTGISFTPDPHTHVGSSTSPSKSLASNDVKTKEGVEPADREKKQHVDETKSSLGMTSQINQSSLRQEVLAKKRKALALKREGKLIEAREELRQAKLLEKGLEEEARNTETPIHASSTSGSSAPVHQKEPVVPNVSPPKPLSGRDRFKLQQESLSHKRQALKLRREGRVEEAEAEFELAKALEAQLDELTSQGSKNSSNEPESADGVVVDDFLDPQLLSALKAIGIHDDNIVSQGQVIHSDKVNPRKSENSSQVIHSDKVNPSKSGSSSQERIQLEERIKGEKLKALNLKRSGKQAEALDALRQAKMFQKKLDSLT